MEMSKHLGEKISKPGCAGLVSFSRVNGRTLLFDSPFVHQGFVAMRVLRCESEWSLSRVWHYPREEYIEVWMSYSQFAEAITTMNVGSGVPCTVRHLMGKEFDPPSLEGDRVKFNAEVDEASKEAIVSLNELIAAISEESMSKKAKDRLVTIARNALRKLSSSAPFIANQYAEYLDGLEQRAKTEIAAYADTIVRQTGLNTLGISGGLAGQSQLPDADR